MVLSDTALKEIYQERYFNLQAKDAVYRTLRDAIIEKKVEPDTRLNSSALAKLFYLSRTPVESALERLYFEELVTSTGASGYQTYGLDFKQTRDSNEFMLDLYSISNVLSNIRLDSYYQNTLEDKLKELEKLTDLSHYLYESNLFHLLIAESTGNQNLLKALKRETMKSALIQLDFHNNEKSLEFMHHHSALDKKLFECICEGNQEEIIACSKEHNQHMSTFIFKKRLLVK